MTLIARVSGFSHRMESAWFKHVSCTLNNLIAINGLYLSVEIQKILTKLSKEKNCEIIGQ